MNKSQEEILEKLAKLKAKQKSAEEIGSAHEAEAFAAKIMELLVLYNLSADEIQDPTIKEPEDNTVRVDMENAQRKTEGGAMDSIMVVVSKHCMVRPVRFKSGSKYALFGELENVKQTIFLYEYLVQSARSLSNKAIREQGFTGNKNTFKRSYYRGFVIGVDNQLEALRRAMQAKQEFSNLPMVIKNQIDRADNLKDQHFSNLTAGRAGGKQTKGHAGAYLQGKHDGGNINLNKQIR